MRPFDDEMDVRREQRQRYFEDPSYRKWSDIQCNSARMLYEGTTDDDFSLIIYSVIVKINPIHQITFEPK